MAESENQSEKPPVIQYLFERLWPDGSERPAQMIVTGDEIAAAILATGAELSTRNTANFLKDFIRKPTCNSNWPLPLIKKEITARQRYGKGQVFEFVSFRANDKVPFPDRFDPRPDMAVLQFEALTIPREARALGRADEPWLTQVIVGQRIVYTHFAVVATHLRVQTLAHLQMSVKTQPEIDATFLATLRIAGPDDTDREIRAYVTGEAKQIGERILEDQIREQVAMAFKLTSELAGADAIDAVMPFAFKVVRHLPEHHPPEQGIYVAQFAPILRDDFEMKYRDANLHEMPLTLETGAIYIPRPPIRGISFKKAPKDPKPKPAKVHSGRQSKPR